MALFFSAAVNAFFDDAIHASIPGDAKEISADRHQYLMAQQATGKRIAANENGDPVAVDRAVSLDDARKVQLQIINADATKAIAAIAATYPQFEIDTWQDQEAEARAWLADSAALTPTLSPIATARGITLADLCTRVIVKAEAYRPAVAAVIGKRQALEDAIGNADTVAAVKAIKWPAG